MTYVGWTCGRCGGPVAGRFSICEECGFGGRPDGDERAPAAGILDLSNVGTRELTQLVELLRHLRGDSDPFERERLCLVDRFVAELRRRAGVPVGEAL